MQVNLKQLGCCSVLSFLLGVGLVWKYARVSEVVEKEVVRNNVVTVTKEVTRPDGSKEIVTTSTDKTVSKAESDAKTVPTQPQWHLSASAVMADKPDFGAYKPVYGLQIEKQFLGPISLGLRVQTDKQIGAVIGYTF